jgi:hypothetical protein
MLRLFDAYSYVLRDLQDTHSKQATGAIWRNLTTDQIKVWEIKLPPLAMQIELTDRLEIEFLDIQNLRNALQAQVTAINGLPSTLLQEAFAGRK